MAIPVMLLVAIVVQSVGASAYAERRVALVIGNDIYTHLPKLNNAGKDAEDMADKLREVGFETILVRSFSRSLKLMRAP